MGTANKRLLMEIDQTIREINRETINPEIPELSVDDMKPVMQLTARARMLYLKKLFFLADTVHDDMPTQEQIDELSELRSHYEEMVSAAQAMETAIQRGYLDVVGNKN